MKRLILLSTLFCLAILTALPVYAGDNDGAPPKSFGPRLGYSVNPDQFVIGFQAELGPVVESARMAPSFDLGFGDDITTFTLNGDIRLTILKPPKSNTAFYVALGPTLLFWDYKGGDSDLEIGLTATAGIKFPMGQSAFYNLEGRFGIGDVPDFRIMAGILFGGR
nr:hypothetical protein [candidate division Zixibacteria bacterium]